MQDDPELLRRYTEENSETAFAGLVNRHLNLVYFAALRRTNGDAHRAADVSQIVFTALAREARSLARHTSLASWLYTATRNAAHNVMREEKRRCAREQEAQTMHELFSGEPETSEAEWVRLRPLLDAAMDELGETDRHAVLLRYFEVQPFARVGAALGLGEDAARMRVERALEKLRALLERRGVTSTSAALGVILASQTTWAAPTGLAASVAGAALTGAAASGAALAGVVAATNFMNAKTTLLTVTAVLAIGFSIYEFNTLRREREAAAGARGELLAQLQIAQQRLVAAERQRAALQSELETARAAKSLLGFKPTLAGAPAPASAPAPAVTAAPAGRDGFFYLGSGSMTREEARRRKGQILDTNLAALYRELNLTPAQREQLKNLMLDTEEANSQLFSKAVAEARARNPNFDRADQHEVFEVSNAQREREQQAAVRQTLGETAAQALQNYQATFPVRIVTKQLAANLFNSEAPLLPAQADQLIEIMARNARGPAGKVDLVALNVEATVAQASGLLSPVQLAELRKAADMLVESAKTQRERNTTPMATLKAAGK